MTYPNNYIHAGYKLQLNKLSKEELFRFKPFLKYTEVKKKKDIILATYNKHIKINKGAYVEIKVNNYGMRWNNKINNSLKVYTWFIKKKGITRVLSTKYIYTCSKYQLLVLEGEIAGEKVLIVMSKNSEQFGAYKIKKMVNLGLLGDRHPFEMSIECTPYVFVQKWKKDLLDSLVLKSKFIY